jgi:hypothetical protein
VREMRLSPYKTYDERYNELLISLLTDPEYLDWETWPPYDPNEAVVGEKATQESQMLLKPVCAPTVILTVSLVACRLVGLTEICRTLEETSKPLMKTLMTGLSDLAKGALILAYASAQLHEPRVWMLSK